ncbi:MAG TPA: hypothetical protein VNZ52_04795 [Candidatus Thermoplasmatota archaeon]|nr:hypothetical protein [Candidatus Thermoplasmatota archaeon]
MNKTVVLLAIGLALTAFTVVPAAASACGWQFTCDTKTWAREEVGGFLFCVMTYDSGDIDVPRCPPPHLH